MIWQLYYNGQYVDMPSPAEYTVEANDLDDDSYRSVVDGSIVRELVSRMWQKIEMNFNFRTESELEDMFGKLNSATQLTIRCKSPIIHPDNGWATVGSETTGWVQLVGYINSYSAQMVNLGHGNKGYTCSFAFVEGYR